MNPPKKKGDGPIRFNLTGHVGYKLHWLVILPPSSRHSVKPTLHVVVLQVIVLHLLAQNVNSSKPRLSLHFETSFTQRPLSRAHTRSSNMALQNYIITFWVKKQNVFKIRVNMWPFLPKIQCHNLYKSNLKVHGN